MANKKKIPFTNSPEVMAALERIKSQKVRRYNKYGEWVHSGKPSPFELEIVDMRAVLR